MPEVWMKTLREENFFGPITAGDDYVLEEPAWRDADSVPQFTVDGAPKGCPSWAPGDGPWGTTERKVTLSRGPR